MIKKQQILIIALLALVSMLIMPVSAWDELWTVSNDGVIGLGGFNGLFITNLTYAAANMTRYTYSGVCEVDADSPYWDAGLSGTLSVDFCGGYPGVTGTCPTYATGRRAWGKWSWDITEFDVYTPCEFEFVFDGWESPITQNWVQLFPVTSQIPGSIAHAGNLKFYYNSTVHPTDLNSGWIAVHTNTYLPNGTHTTYSGIPSDVAASFTCVPTSQFPNFDVVCTDTSTGVPTSWLWVLDAETLEVPGWQTDTAQNFTWQSAYLGWYSVNLWANNTGSGDWENKSNYIEITNLLPQESPYHLTLNPAAVIAGANVTATITSVTDPTLALVNGIQYSYYDEGAWLSTDFFEPTTPTLTKQYGLFDGDWKQFNTTVLYFSDTHSGIPNPDILQFSGTSGTKTVRCFVYLTTGQYYELTGTVIVGQGAGYIVTRIQAFDGLGGGLIYYPEIDIYNKNTGQWTNRTYASGAAEISTPVNTYFNVYGIKAGYINAKLLNIVARDDITYQLPFFTGVTPSAGNQSLSFWVTNVNGQAISGAQVILKEAGTTSVFIGTTIAGGIYNPIVKQSTLYTYTVTKSGYIPGAGSLTTSAESSDVWVHQLKVGVVVTATIPPGEGTDIQKAEDAFGQWMDVLGDITSIAIGVTIIWLMWLTVYMITGGKIIKKIMQRRR